MRADTVLPIVRAAMARGEGPPAVLDWLRRQGESATRARDWTDADEERARVLAAHLAKSMNGRRLAAADTGWAGRTAGPSSRSSRWCA